MSDTKNTGGAAFPSGLEYAPKGFEPTQGMTLRDYFAAKAMQGIFSHVDVAIVNTKDVAGADVLAAKAYCMADAMLKAREQ